MKQIVNIIIAFAALVAAPASAQINTEQVMRVGQNALYFDDYMLSIQYFNQAIQAKPYMAKPYFLRSIAKLNLDDFAGAIADASKAIELNPFISDAWEVRGVAYQNTGRNAEAVADYRQALTLIPRNRQIMFNMAMALQDLEKYSEADSIYGELLRYYPKFDNGYLGRARMHLALSDTVAANDDIARALDLNKNALNAYIMRSEIAMNRRDYKAALEDMNVAIKLQPKVPGLYINRAFLRYNCDDYFGAMADYDYAIELDPLNSTALFNRGLLLAEVNANDRALLDFTKVLDLNPDEYRAVYNRAMILNRKAEYDKALADINRVINMYPDFPGGYFIRYDIERGKGDLRAAKADYDKAMALARAAKPIAKTDGESATTGKTSDEDVAAEIVSSRFASLLTVADNVQIEEEYNNSAIRGRVQDRNFSIEIEPLMELSYYNSPTELRQDTYYMKEVNDLNSQRLLRFVVLITNALPNLDEDIYERHFKSIEYYNSYIATHAPRAVDYLGRALDFMTVRDYDGAIRDIHRALELMPNYALAYMLLGQASFHNYQLISQKHASDKEPALSTAALEGMRAKALDEALEAYDKVIEISPNNVPAWFNKGNVLTEKQDYTSALAAYSRAIELKPDMGEAYFNRGYVYLKLGNRKSGIADLSKAGEYGIVGAYNLIKRISQ